MEGETDFDRKLDLLAKYSEDIGDLVRKKGETDLIDITIRDEDYSLIGHRCERGDHSYIIGGHPDLRFFTIAYFVDIEYNLSGQMKPDHAKAIVQEEEFEDNSDMQREATKKLLDEVSSHEMDLFESYVFQISAGATHETMLIRNENDIVVLFAVSKDIFPYEDSFGISDFYDAVMAVVNAGEKGNRLLQRTIFLDVDEENPKNTTIEFNYNW